MAPVKAAVAHLDAHCTTDKVATMVEGDVDEEACHQAYMLFQAHHDHCDHHVLPTELEGKLHVYEHDFEDCFIRRQYDADMEKCPAVDCADADAMQAATTTLGASCSNDCTSAACKNAIQLVLMAHDTCDESLLPSNVEVALHDFEEICEDKLCNTADAPFVLTCEEDDHDDHEDDHADHEDDHADHEDDDSPAGALRASVLSVALVGATVALLA